MQELFGVIPAVLTPVEGHGTLNATSFEMLLQRLYAKGAHGVYVCGQTGEGLQLPLAVRQHATELAVAASPKGKQVIVHIGAANTAEAVVLARHAAKAGAAAVSSLPPGSAYSYPEVRAYYESIGAAAEIPVLVYYFPDFSASIRTVEQVFDLCSIPNVVGLKFTDFDLYRLSLIQRAGHTIYSGRDEVFAAGLLMGAHGGIGSFYNLAPELFVDVYEKARAGNWSEARATQDRINDLIRAVLAFPMIAAMKRLLTWSGIDCGYAVEPRRRLAGEEEAALRDAVSRAGFHPESFLQ
ncbi:MAG: dihydrodipicolinate synthase family protein [Bryobacterales bacterium]|nr:dihydrodipicolinate synthase family protein [Bryobacterales bacterium]